MTFDLSTVAAVNNIGTFAFRIVFGGGSTASTDSAGNNRIDNLVLSGTANPVGPPVPEPASVVMLGLGLAGVGVVARRRAR